MKLRLIFVKSTLSPKKQSSANGKRKHNDVDALIGATIGGRGLTNVDLRWYPNHEFKNLLPEQMEELKAWRATPAGFAAFKASRKLLSKKQQRTSNGKQNGQKGNNGGGTDNKKSTKKFNNKVKKVVKAQLASAVKAMEEEQNEIALQAASLNGDAKAIASSATTQSKKNGQRVSFEDGQKQRNAHFSSVIGRMRKKLGLKTD